MADGLGAWRWVAVAAAVAGILAAAGCERTAPRNFGVVKDGVLYRSGQLTPTAFVRVLEDSHIRTVVTLRPDRGAAPNSDAHEDGLCRERGVKFVRITPPTATDDGDAPLDQMAQAFLQVMDDPANFPVLVHCTAGRDRTGTMSAVYRMEYDHWPPGRALAEMGEYGFDPAKDAAARAYADFIRAYRPRNSPKQ